MIEENTILDYTKASQRGQDIEYRFSEIAAILNISENNAKVQMSRAVRFMRKEFLKYKGFNRKL